MRFGHFPWRLLALHLALVVAVRAAPAVSLQDPTGQELIFLSLAIKAAVMGPFALVENEPPVTIGPWMESWRWTIPIDQSRNTVGVNEEINAVMRNKVGVIDI